jgi:hypothetical protein
MNFDPRKLPPSVYNAYKMGAMAWPIVVDKAIEAGFRDVDRLTDIVFFLHHPERSGRLLGPTETGLINQWKGFRNLIAPRVPASAGRIPIREHDYEFRPGKWA